MKNTENPIDLVYSAPPDDEKSRSSLDPDPDPPLIPPTIWCAKCQEHVTPLGKGLCPRCGRFLASNKLAQKYFTDVSARKRHLDKLAGEFKPSTVTMQAECDMLSRILAELEHVRCGTPEHARLVTSAQGLFASLENAKARKVEPPALSHLTNDELTAHALAVAEKALELQRGMPAPPLNTAPTSSPIVESKAQGVPLIYATPEACP